MSKAETQERLRKERAERDAKMAKQKADRLAAEAKKNDELEQHAKRVAALYKSMREFEAHAEEKAGFELKKAAEKRAALEQALVEARVLCKAAGENFKAFQEKFAPNYKRTRLYQVLAIADGRKTAEDIREEEREKKRRQRAGKVSGTGNVPDDSAPEGEKASAKPAKTPEPTKTPEAAGAAPEGEKADEKPALPDDLSIPPFVRRGEAPPQDEAPELSSSPSDGEGLSSTAEASPSCYADDEVPFHTNLWKSLNAAITLCGVAKNWPEMSEHARKRRDLLVRELHGLGFALVKLATPINKKLH